MFVHTEVKNGIGFLSLNRQGTNSLNIDFLNQLYESFSELESSGQVKVLVFKSMVNFGFSSGLDLGDFYVRSSSQITIENIQKAVLLMYKISQRILNSPIICVAALYGGVIGSAITLAVSCDFRIAANNTWLWSPDPQYGGLLADGGVEITQALVGTSRAAMLHLSNERVNVNNANDWGLFYKIVNRDMLDEDTLLFATKLLKCSDISLGLSKKLLNKNLKIECPERLLSGIFNSHEVINRLGSYVTK